MSILVNIDVPDLELAAGATQEQALSEHAYGRLALFANPFGNGFCLLQFNIAGYDAIVET